MNKRMPAAVTPETSGARPAGEVSPVEAARHVQAMFNSIAPRYDLLNHLLSMGLDRLWWGRTAAAFAAVLERPEARILDLCCGTGDQTAALLARRPADAEPIIGLDFSSAMLDRARTKFAGRNVRWIEADAMHLPFPDGSFDLVTAAFGFRNLNDYAAGLCEIARVLAHGGQVGILEANQPEGVRGFLYNAYFHNVLPVVGGLLSGDRAAYRYLPDSVARFPRPPRMIGMLLDAGFTAPTWEGYLLHSAGLYRASR